MRIRLSKAPASRRSEAIQSLSPQEFTCLELTLTNRPTAPILTLVAFNGDGGRPKNGP